MAILFIFNRIIILLNANKKYLCRIKMNNNILKLNKLKTSFNNNCFKNLTIQDEDFSFNDCSNLIFENCNFVNCDFENADISNCVFIKCTINKCNLLGIKASLSSFINTLMENSQSLESDFDSTKFDNCKINNVNFLKSDFNSAFFINTKIKKCIFLNTVLENAIFKNTNITSNLPKICPKCGEFIGYKKIKNKIIVLKIQKDSKRISLTCDNCRCDKARVIKIENLDGTTSNIKNINSDFDKNIKYILGEIVQSKTFNMNRFDEVTDGIHFFMNKNNAKIYTLK